MHAYTYTHTHIGNAIIFPCKVREANEQLVGGFKILIVEGLNSYRFVGKISWGRGGGIKRKRRRVQSSTNQI